MSQPNSRDQCPCSSGQLYGQCCGPFLSGHASAPTAQQLMRSRFTAFATGDVEYLRSTWHPDTRPHDLELDPAVEWLRLIISDTVRGGPFDTYGEVEFVAMYREPSPDKPGSYQRGRQHERSTFEKVEGRWLYVDGVL